MILGIFFSGGLILKMRVTEEEMLKRRVVICRNLCQIWTNEEHAIPNRLERQSSRIF